MSTVIKDALEVIAKIRSGNLDQLVALPPLLNALEAEINVKMSLTEIREQLGSLEKTVQQSQYNLDKRVTSLEDSLRRQADQYFLTDQEYKQLIKDIHPTLLLIEQYFRIHT